MDSGLSFRYHGARWRPVHSEFHTFLKGHRHYERVSYPIPNAVKPENAASALTDLLLLGV